MEMLVASIANLSVARELRPLAERSAAEEEGFGGLGVSPDTIVFGVAGSLRFAASLTHSLTHLLLK
jgi:hypothetical protein